MRYISFYDSPLGRLTLESDGDHLCGLWFPGRYMCTCAEEKRSVSVFRDTERWLDIYFSGREPGFYPDICLYMTPFGRRVCEIIRTIPYGEVMTYGEIAGIIAAERGIGRMSAQAVGGAAGRNPVPIIIPCHRVIGSGGDLTGYSGGMDIKVGLLKLEGALAEDMYSVQNAVSYRPIL